MMRGVAGGLGCAGLLLLAAPAAAQDPGTDAAVLVKLDPTPAELRLGQDRLDLAARSTLDVGSGARAYGMGGAFLARADDATAASWNPAGLSYLRRPEFSLVGARNSFAREEVRDVLETEDGSGRSMDFVAATYPVALGRTSGAVQVSYQRVINFTSERTVENPDVLFSGESEGGFDVIALGTGLRVTPWLRLGATVNRWLNGYTQTLIREPRVGRTRGRVDHFTDYALSGWNANVGLIWEPFESLNFGVVGKTPFGAEVTLARERVDIEPSGSDFTTNRASRDDLRLDFPGAVGAGVSWRPRSTLTLSVDYTRTFWSRARIRNFFTLAPTPESGEPITPEESGDFWPALPYPTLTVGANDAEVIRAGVEYVIIGDRVRWPIRAGYFRDRQSTSAAIATGDAGEIEVVQPRFNGFTAGAGVGIGPLLLDVAFLHESGDYVDPSLFPQSFTSRRVLVSIIYRHLVRR